ncbi:MAG: hypothetical protein OHK0029_02970 [Armatimonadaceae bacterium]
MKTVRRRLSLVVLSTVLSLSLSVAARAQDAPEPEKPKVTVSVKPAADEKPQSAQKFVLVYKAEKGQERRNQSVFKFTMQPPPGQPPLRLDGREVVKRVYTDVAANGDITFEDRTLESKTTVNGQEAPGNDEEEKSVHTYTIRPNGMLVKFTSTEEKDKDEPDSHLTERLFVASTPIYPAEPVGPGEKWTQEFKADKTLGLRAATAKYEVLGVEKVGTAEAVRLKMDYAETEADGIALKTTFLIEKISGDVLWADYKIDRFPFGSSEQPIVASGNVLERRSQGGPLVASKGVVVSELGKPREKTIAETVKDFDKLPGVFTLYRKQESGKDTLYLEITKNQFDKLLLLQATASTGNAEQLIAGDPIADTVFTFTEQDENTVVLRIPNWQWRAEADSPLGRAVKRSFTDGYLDTFKVVAREEERDAVLIDVTQFFQSDFAQITLALSGGGLPAITGNLGPGGFMQDRTNTFIQDVKNFPDNMVVRTRYHFRRGGRQVSGTPQADNRSLPLIVNYNLFPLPNDPVTFAPTNGYRPRMADPRIGYFTTEYTDFSDDSREDQITRFILRWDLRKKNPDAEMSPPVKPVVFWMDNSIPVEYRSAVKKGLLAWNKAFERIGIQDAIVVEQMPDDAKWDHADMRYNVIRWAVTPDGAERNGVAIALFRQNPLTGEILNASITVDASWTRYAKLERRKLIDPAVAFARASGMDVDMLFHSPVPLSPEMEAAVARHRDEHLRMAHGDPRRCRIADEMAMDAFFGMSALRMALPAGVAAVREKQYTDQLITEVVAHEFGHILGLRHNFVGSTGLSLEDLKNPELVRNAGTSASVMDYNAFNIAAIREKDVDFFSQTVGTYDLWAIEYGYTALPSVSEEPMLKRIASRSNEPGHAYQSDEAAFVALDPRVVPGDISSDPLAYWGRVITMSRYLLFNLDKNVPKQGESYWEFTKAFQMLLNNYARAAGVASRYVGGLTLNRNHKGDPKEKPTTEPIDAAHQKQALELLNTYIFAPNAFRFPERYYTRLTTDPYGFAFSADFPVADQMAGIQRTAFQRLFSPAVLRRVANNEFKKGGDASKVLTLPDLFNSVSATVWAELSSKETIPTLRRQLQREWIGTMSKLVTQQSGAPDDARMLAWAQLKQVRSRLAAAQTAKTGDEYTRIHLSESVSTIDRILNASLTLDNGGGGGGANLLQMLFGKTPN